MEGKFKLHSHFLSYNLSGCQQPFPFLSFFLFLSFPVKTIFHCGSSHHCPIFLFPGINEHGRTAGATEEQRKKLSMIPHTHSLPHKLFSLSVFWGEKFFFFSYNFSARRRDKKIIIQRRSLDYINWLSHEPCTQFFLVFISFCIVFEFSHAFALNSVSDSKCI